MEPIVSTEILYPVYSDYYGDPIRVERCFVCGEFVSRRWQIPNLNETPIRLRFFRRLAAQAWPIWLQKPVSWPLQWSARRCAKPGAIMLGWMSRLLGKALGDRLDNGAVVKLWVQCEIVED